MIIEEREKVAAKGTGGLVRLSIDDIPSLVQTTRAMATRTRQTAVGGDRFESEAFSAAPLQVSPHVHALYVKSSIWIRPALQWVGGFLFELWKGAGAIDELARTRDVTICVHTGKLFGKHSRTELLPAISGATEQTQFGEGMHGGETAVAHLGLNAAGDWITSCGKCCITLYTDIAGAFASMWRQVVLPTEEGDGKFLRSLSAAGVEDAELAGSYAELVDVSCWKQQGASDHAIAVTTALHTNTWCAIDGSPGILCTHR